MNVTFYTLWRTLLFSFKKRKKKSKHLNNIHSRTAVFSLHTLFKQNTVVLDCSSNEQRRSPPNIPTKHPAFWYTWTRMAFWTLFKLALKSVLIEAIRFRPWCFSICEEFVVSQAYRFVLVSIKLFVLGPTWPTHLKHHNDSKGREMLSGISLWWVQQLQYIERKTELRNLDKKQLDLFDCLIHTII